MTGDKSPSEPALIPVRGKPAERDHFYEKLRKLNESSGLSSVFNFRHTVLDLHDLYEEVIHRGGFYQVTKGRKWDDVASAMNLKCTMNASRSQLQSIYETLLLQYELLYCHKVPQELKPWPEKCSQGLFSGVNPSSSSLIGKRKYRDVNDLIAKGDISKNTVDSGQMVSGHKTTQSSAIIEFSNPNVEEFVEMPAPPLKPRTGYQIFLRLETQRLKKVHGQSSGSCNIRELATQAWRSLTEEGKEPYMEASRMDKERYKNEMVVYEELKINHGTKSQISASNPASTMTNFSKSMEILAINRSSTMSLSTAAEISASNPTSTMTIFSNATKISASNPITTMTSLSKKTSVCNPTSAMTSFSKAAEMSACNPTSTITTFAKVAETDDVYHVSTEADSDDLISPDDDMVELAIEVMNNAQSNDPMLHWDCGSLEDSPIN